MLTLTASATARALHNRINQTDSPFDADATICDIWSRQVQASPDAVAIADLEGSLSYKELDGLANAVAATLVAAKVAPGDMVLVAQPRSRALVIMVLAILKAGAVYQPIDLAWPLKRVAELAEETGASLCLGQLPGPVARVQTLPVTLEELVPVSSAPKVAISGDSIAYVNFTSGSTGKPKGVLIQHRAVLRLVQSPSFMRLSRATRMLHMAPICFDAATLEIWGPLLNGGTCVLYPDEMLRLSRLRRVLDTCRVTDIFLTTAIFNMIMDEDPKLLARLDCVMTGGEAHSLSHIDKGFRTLGAGKLVSVYGPTESTTYASFYPITRLRLPHESALPIGKPIQNTRAFVITENRLAEPGETGEIWLAGSGLSAGYLNQAALTAEKFVAVTLDGTSFQAYRTGDLGYLDTSGDIVFQGRADDQIKVNGNRVELGEMQHHLLSLPAVERAIVFVSGDIAGEKQVLAFVILSDPTTDPADLRAELARSIPAYMIPCRIVPVAEFPLSLTGKIDKKALLDKLKPHPCVAA